MRNYLQLVRFPAVFTAVADILLGYFLTHSELTSGRELLLLIVASAALYLAGMALNDLFDRHIDAQERPGRPIPSGRVSITAAVLLSTALIAVGLVAAWFVGASSFKIACALLLAIIGYDALLKNTFLGPWVMGSCRFFNVMLGASATFFVWGTPQTYIAAGLAIYVTGITYFSRNEATQSASRALKWAIAVVNVGLLVVALYPFRAIIPGLVHYLGRVAGFGLGETSPYPAVAALALTAGFINIRLFKCLSDPGPQNVQRGVRTMLLALIVIDAALIHFKTGNLTVAVATLLLLIPALYLGRWIFVT